jgi:diaminohydroxyphosphoribosylaminopyrimidine deaminase/5-amino-6-(5-phosphoribosylamino)uracil reductase
LISELVRSRQLDYLFAYRAPVLFADDKAKTMFAGLRPEKIDQAVRLTDVRHETFGDDSLMRGRVSYPDKLLLDETVFSLR